MLRKCSVNDFTELAEALLCFHAWYKLGVVKKNDQGKLDRGIIHASIQRMLAMVRFFTPRKKGNGWKLQKFHDMLHLALDMERFGPPSNYDAGPHESGLRIWAKLPAMTSQKRGYNIFVRQVAARIYEFQSLSAAMRDHGIEGVRDKALQKAVDALAGLQGGEIRNKDDGKAKLGGTTFRVYGSAPMGTTDNVEEEEGVCVFQQSERVNKDKRTKSDFVVHPVIENYLRWQPHQQEELSIPPICDGGKRYWEMKTECSLVPLDGGIRVTLRCHPNYKNEGPWYDWVMVNFETNRFFHKENNRRQFNARQTKNNDPELEKEFDPMQHEPQYPDNCVPCKVLAFARSQTGKTMALVHGCQF